MQASSIADRQAPAQKPDNGLRLQLWSSFYEPEPQGIALVSRTWAKEMHARGHEIEVVTSHPSYPEPRWGWRAFPYREVRDGIVVRRFPLIIGRASGGRRMVQELSYVASVSAGLPWLGTPDAIVAVSPSFPALAPAMASARLRGIPWVLWLQDILPEGAVATGFVGDDTAVVKAAKRFERLAYASAHHIYVLSDSFKRNLQSKGVPDARLTRVYNPATWSAESAVRDAGIEEPPRVLCMGNIGRSQGLPRIVEAFEADQDLARLGTRLILAGAGVAEPEVRSAIRTDRVIMTGLLSESDLRAELGRAALGVVTQHYSGPEFNVPSKLMNYFSAGLPVVASVHPEGEVAHLLHISGGGWATDSADPATFTKAITAALEDPGARKQRSDAARAFALQNFTPAAVADCFESGLAGILR